MRTIAVVKNPCVNIPSAENITYNKLPLDFKTNMREDLGMYSLQENYSSKYKDISVGDVYSLCSEASKDEGHEN